MSAIVLLPSQVQVPSSGVISIFLNKQEGNYYYKTPDDRIIQMHDSGNGTFNIYENFIITEIINLTGDEMDVLKTNSPSVTVKFYCIRYVSVKGKRGVDGSRGPQGYQGNVGQTGAGGTQGYYGVFENTDEQTLLPATPAPVVFNTTVDSFGVSIGAPNSRIVIANSGIYNFQHRLQIHREGIGGQTLTIWFRKNGVDIPNSSTNLDITDVSIFFVAPWNYVSQMNNGDYFEIMAYSDGTTMHIENSPADVGPAVSSSVLTVTQVAYLGPQGLQGSQGSQGVQGNQGAGTQGSQGNQGVIGDMYETVSTPPGTQCFNVPTIVGTQVTFFVATDLAYTPNQDVIVTPTAHIADHFHGFVISYNSGTGEITIQMTATDVVGVENYCDWIVNLDGAFVVGSQGNQGNQGVQGNIGSTGFQGNQGVTGVQGNQGQIGTQGNQGQVGIQGVQGNQGAGTQGSQGNQGVIGDMYETVSTPPGTQCFNVPTIVGTQVTFFVATDLAYTPNQDVIVTPTAHIADHFHGFVISYNSGTGEITIQMTATDVVGVENYCDWIVNLDGAFVVGSQGNQGNQGSIGLQGNQGFQGTGTALFQQGASVTVSNTVVETTLLSATGIGSVIIPANYFNAVGKTMRISIKGYYNKNASITNPALTIKIKFNGTTYITGVFVNTDITSSPDAGHWQIETFVTCYATGISPTGQVFVQGTLLVIQNGGGGNSVRTTSTTPFLNTASQSFDTTVTQTMNLTAQWGTASPSVSITSTNIVMQ